MEDLYSCKYCKFEGARSVCNRCVSSVQDNGFKTKPSMFKPKQSEVDDVVNHPSHYQTKSGLETIQVIEAFTEGLTGYEAVETGNVLKYICRWKKKNGLQDLKKARWYLNRLIDNVEKSSGARVDEIKADVLYAAKTLEEIEKENK